MKAYGGVDLGGTKIQTVVVDDMQQVIGQARHPTPSEGGPQAVADAIVEAMRQAADGAKVHTEALGGIGVGSPGLIDGQTGVVKSARNLPDWEGEFGLGDSISRALGPGVKVGNDVQVATDGEFHLGAGRPYDSLLGVFWGTGVGGGLVLGGKPWLGRGSAGEFGHMVIKRDGAQCPCGRQGCVEAYAGRAAMEAKARREHDEGTKTDLFKLMEKHDRDRLSSGIWSRALEHGDKLAKELIERAEDAIGVGIASAVNLLDVEAVILGGGMGVRFGEDALARIEKAMMPHLFNDGDPPALRVAALGDLGGAIGASLLVSPAS